MQHWKAPWKERTKGFFTLIAKVEVEMVLERQMDCIGPDPAGGGYSVAISTALALT